MVVSDRQADTETDAEADNSTDEENDKPANEAATPARDGWLDALDIWGLLGHGGSAGRFRHQALEDGG